MPFRAPPPLSTDHILSLLDLCLRASAVILDFYDAGDDGVEVRQKADRSPVTEADLASHHLIVDGLRDLTPEVPILSEESSGAELARRRDWSRFWMVDPLDGTREFIERTGQFTINVALIENHRPVLGLIAEPRRGRIALGIVGDGAWYCERAGGQWQFLAIHTRSLPREELVILSSHRHRNERLSQSLAFLESRFELLRQNSGSALKFCDLAEGVGDCYPRFSPCSEWDVAAGDALVTAAGGRLTGLDGRPLRYNDRDSLLSPNFLAVGDPSQELWEVLLDELECELE